MSATETSNNLTKEFDLREKLIADFSTLSKTLFGADNSIIQGKRTAAINSFSKLGFPNKKNEEYKYTNIEAVLKKDFSASINTIASPKKKDIEAFISVKNKTLLVMLNGIYSDELSQINNLPSGVYAGSLAQGYAANKKIIEKHFGIYADVNADSLIAINTSLAKDGVFIHIPKGTIVDKPFHIINISSSEETPFVQPRNLIVVEEAAQAKIIESYESIASTGKIFTNSLTEIFVGESAKLDNYKIQNELDNSFQVNTTQVYQSKMSLYNSHTITMGGALVRNNLNVVLDDQNIETHLYGLYLLKGNQHVDNHTLVDHRKSNCFSNELYKGIMDEKSNAVFNGKIFVRQDAQKTNAFQSNKNILLSDDATINTKPQLEIYANDVKCSHGTSTGKMDEEALFYLRSRGIGETSAKKMLMYAFAEDLVNNIKIEEVRTYVEGLIAKRFE